MRPRTVLAAGLAALITLAAPAVAGAAGDLRLEPCDEPGLEDVRCGELEVPADRGRPHGRTTTLAVAVRPADDGARRIGPLLLNNGGGGSAIEQLRLALTVGGIGGVLTERFDLVAVDPRGVGQSTPIRCGRPQRSPGVTYFPDDRRAFRALVRDNRALEAACRRRSEGRVLDGLDLRTSARDLDAVRRALGERRVSFYGIQHTARVARTYARMFPRRLRDITVDTVVDDSRPVAQRLADEVVGIETALHRFAAWCQTTPECALNGQDALAAFDAVRTQAEREPIPVRGGAPLTGEDIGRAVQEWLVIRFAWPGFAAGLAQAAAGDGTLLAGSPDGTYDYLQDHAVSCATTPPAARTYAELAQLQRMVRELAPRTGGSSRAWATAAGCLGWSDRPARPDRGTPVRRVPRALILQSTHQTLAPYSDAFSFSRMLPGSRVLSREGDDYSLVLFSACAASAFDAYATRGALPAPGAICRD